MEDKDMVSKAVDYIFKVKENTWYLMGIFTLGFLLRLIAAINLSVYADDMHFVTHAINFISAGRLETYDQSAGLWFAFTDLMYNIFGFTQIGSRMAALVFGSFSLLLIYLLSKEFFSEDVSIMSAFLLAIAPFHIKSTVAEMDVMAMFFVLLSMLLFVRGLKSKKTEMFIISGLFMGLAVYTKVYPLLFIPSLLIYFAIFNYKNNKKIFSKNNLKVIFTFLAIIFIFCIPAITHNYLLYKDKEFLDLQFTRTLSFGKSNSAQYYSWDAQFDAKNSWSGLFFGDTKYAGSGKPLLIVAIDFIRLGDPVVFYLGILGILYITIYRKEYIDYSIFFVTSMAFVIPFLASIILLPKHFISLELLLVPTAAFFIFDVSKKFSNKDRDILKVTIMGVFILSLVFLGAYSIKGIYSSNSHHFYSESGVGQMIDFKEKNIPKNSIIISDSRIYRGRIHWYSQNRPYLEGVEFIRILNDQDKIQGSPIPLEIYYVECAIDDCGWGTIKNQPALNDTMESLTELFRNSGVLVKEINEAPKGKNYYPLFGEKETVMNVYKAKISLKGPVTKIASQPKEWFLYNIGYEPVYKNFDYFDISGGLDLILYKFARFIVMASLIISILSPGYVLYLTYKK